MQLVFYMFMNLRENVDGIVFIQDASCLYKYIWHLWQWNWKVMCFLFVCLLAKVTCFCACFHRFLWNVFLQLYAIICFFLLFKNKKYLLFIRWIKINDSCFILFLVWLSYSMQFNLKRPNVPMTREPCLLVQNFRSWTYNMLITIL